MTKDERLRVYDPLEKLVADALDAIPVAYTVDGEGDTKGLDFYLMGVNVYIECKQFHTPRVAEQMARVENVIVIQGKQAAEMFAAMVALVSGRKP